MVRSVARTAYPVVAGLFVACAIIQVFLAGLGVFDDPAPSSPTETSAT